MLQISTQWSLEEKKKGANITKQKQTDKKNKIVVANEEREKERDKVGLDY